LLFPIAEENIEGLEVSMDDTDTMKIVYSQTYLEEKFPSHILSE
jgi:hypothetical protein